MVPINREYELQTSMSTTPSDTAAKSASRAVTAGKELAVLGVGQIEDDEANRRGGFSRSSAVTMPSQSRTGEAVHRPFTSSVINQPIRTARLGAVPSTGSGGEL